MQAKLTAKCSLVLSDCKQNYKPSIHFSKTVQCLVLKPTAQSCGRYVRVDVLKRTDEFLEITFANTPDIIPCAFEVSLVFDVVTNSKFWSVTWSARRGNNVKWVPGHH